MTFHFVLQFQRWLFTCLRHLFPSDHIECGLVTINAGFVLPQYGCPRLSHLSPFHSQVYNREGVESVGLHDSASGLWVERRRIYDIVNVLESVGEGQNRYTWKGFSAIPKALEDLKKEGLREIVHAADTSSFDKVSDDDEDEIYSNISNFSRNDKLDSGYVPNFDVPPNSGDNRKEKYLRLLTQNFVKLFLCTNAKKERIRQWCLLPSSLI